MAAVKTDPCTIVIFGGSGDLSKRKLVPALYELHVERKIEAGLAAMTEGKTVAHEDARRRWLDG